MLKQGAEAPAEWETEEATAVAELLVVDLNLGGEIVAGTARYARDLGKRLADMGLWEDPVLTWIETRLRDGLLCPMLIPDGARLWIVDPRCYLSTGFLLLACPPASPAAAVAVADSGMLGWVACYPAERLPAADSAEIKRFLDVWDRLDACLSHAHPTGRDTVAEMLRILRAVGGCTGWEAAHLHAVCDPRPDRDCDLPMLSALALTLSLGFSRLGLRDAEVTLSDSEEGILLCLALPCRGDDPTEAPELAACRRVAERNLQLFEAYTEAGVLHLRLCVARKDFARLGIKTEPCLR